MAICFQLQFCISWFYVGLFLLKENMLRLFENKVWKKILAPKKKLRNWRKNVMQFHNSYFLLNSIVVIKWRRKSWVINTNARQKWEIPIEILSRNLIAVSHRDDNVVASRKIFKCIFDVTEYEDEDWTQPAEDRTNL